MMIGTDVNLHLSTRKSSSDNRDHIIDFLVENPRGFNDARPLSAWADVR
jgi:hypothetical protein